MSESPVTVESERPASAGGESAAAAALPREQRAIYDVASHVRFWLVATLGLTLDLWSKQWAFETIDPHERIVLVPYALEFQIMLNKGALFGLGGGMTSLFLVASVCALALVAWMFVSSPRKRWWLHIALGGIVAGALGNMYDRSFVRLLEDPVKRPDGRIVYMGVVERGPDRVVLEEYPPHEGAYRTYRRPDDIPREVGFVRDFIKIPTRVFGRDLWPWVFNVADMLLVGGVALLALHLATDGSGGRRREGDAAVAAAPAGGGDPGTDSRGGGAE